MSENKNIKTSAAQLRANAKYDKEHMKSYTVKMNKELFEIMRTAFSGNSDYNNQNSYTVQAIKEKLQREGYMPNGLDSKDD